MVTLVRNEVPNLVEGDERTIPWGVLSNKGTTEGIVTLVRGSETVPL